MKLNFGFMVFFIAVMLLSACKKDVPVIEKSHKEVVVNGKLNPGPKATCGGSTVIADVDGNIYHIVAINGKCWTKENLKTTHFNDGTPIPTGLNNSDWVNASGAAYSVYNNDTSNVPAYGLLYNWYAVTDTHKLCPIGFHVPTDVEFANMSFFLGGDNVASGPLKEAGFAHWNSPNNGATNAAGFTGLPGGYRFTNGAYNYNSLNGGWWSKTPSTTTTLNAYCRYMSYLNTYFPRGDTYKYFGFSVRCVRD